MSFSAKQLHALRRNLDQRFVRSRTANGRELSYIEGWYAIAQANRIFGFDGWSRETLDSRCILARENRGSFLAVYTAKVRITVQAAGATIIREGHGSGEGHGNSAGEAHDTALKAAETDATKRALATFGRPFGLELYRKDKMQPPPAVSSQPTLSDAQPAPRHGVHPDDTTPIPRPSHYYGRRHESANKAFFPKEKIATERYAPEAPSLVPASPNEVVPRRIDKSCLIIAEPKRLRDKAHLKFVATQACLVCGRAPSDPHHLRFAQPRAIGLKVSDEFTVPLCRGHHRQLHQTGNEQAWWELQKISPLEAARGLWEKTHPRSPLGNTAAVESESDDEQKRNTKTITSSASSQNEPNS
jgi:DNA recombination protein Rad52